jgi:hypothetical protein
MTGGPGGSRDVARRRGPLDPLGAVLVRRIPVKVRDVSQMGCLNARGGSWRSGHLSRSTERSSDDVRVVGVGHMRALPPLQDDGALRRAFPTSLRR